MICAVSTNYASCQVFVSGICNDLLIPTNFPELCLTKGSTGMRLSLYCGLIAITSAFFRS